MKLPKELLGGLPAPDSEGLVRVMASIRIDPEGNATVVRLGDTPVDNSEKEPDPMSETELPDLDAAEQAIYG